MEAGKTASTVKALSHDQNPSDSGRQHNFARDDTTPIPRPSRYYGRRQDPVARDLASRQRIQGNAPAPRLPSSDDASIVPSEPDPSAGKIDKSVLAIAEPKRLRDKAHLKFVAAQPCLICGRQPSDPHHLRFAQPRALGLKVSDEFTVPLCRGHHRQLHQAGNEIAWWEDLGINALDIAKGLWEESHARPSSISETNTSQVDVDSSAVKTGADSPQSSNYTSDELS